VGDERTLEEQCYGVCWAAKERIEELERFAARLKDQMIRNGWRQCAVGQKATQFCGELEEALKGEREACAKVCEEGGLLWGQKYAAAIRARGET
jgi:hypothetical protein